MAKLAKTVYRWLVPLCYGLYLLGWLALALAHFAGDRARPEVVVDLSTAVLQEMSPAGEEGLFLTEGYDPQFVFEGIDQPVRAVMLQAEFSNEPGEMELFYARKEGQGFSAQKRAIGVPTEDGYLYELPAGNLRALRLDPGSLPGNEVQVEALVLNPRLPAAHYFVPGLRGLVGFAVWPTLASCAIYTIIEGAGALGRLARGKGEATKA